MHSAPHRRRSALRRGLLAAAGLALTAYFGAHAATGRHGLEARQRLAARLPAVTAELATLEARKAGLLRDVALLTAEPPPPDVVEEVARTVLGYAYPRETIIVGR